MKEKRIPHKTRRTKREELFEMYIISLYRKEVYNLGQIEENKRVNNAFLVTDYFDEMRYEKIDVADLADSIIENEMNLELSSFAISMQCFPVICTGECIKRHEKETNYGDPFNDFQVHANYINMINVYFAAEAFSTSKSHDRSLLELFEEDLHSILNNCAKVYSNLFRYRIYRSVSSSDLSVIVSCNDIEMPFYISNAIRARYSDATSFPLVLYKTYTIMCIKNVTPGEVSGKFILRFRYSNVYWSQRGNNTGFLELEKKALAETMRLNGRYDFYSEFSVDEFCKLFPYIEMAKLGKDNDEKNIVVMEKSFEEPRLEYVRKLIEQNYLSFINERFVFDVEDYQHSELDKSETISLFIDEKFDYLENKIDFLLNIMRERSKDQYRRIQCIWEYRKDLAYNMRLLQRLITLCSSINGLSEIRINSCILLTRLQTVMDGIDRYLNQWDEGNKEILIYLDKSLRNSINALNCYADYLISNNLQSLQVPNYNLESSMSVEKYIIAYTGILDTIIEKFRNSPSMTRIGANKGLPKLMPILVPEESNESLSITVQFRNNYRESDNKQQQLLIVKCPSFRYMTNVPELMASMFHELAHQFRYEDRKQRNKVLIRYMVQLHLEQAVIKMLSRNPDIRIDDLNNLKARLKLEDKMTSAFITCFYPPKAEDYNLSLPLLYEKVRTDIKGFVNAGDLIERYRTALHEFASALPVSDLREQAIESVLMLFSSLNEYSVWNTTESIKTMLNLVEITKKQSKRVQKCYDNAISILYHAEELPEDIFRKREAFYNICSEELDNQDKREDINIHGIIRYLGFDHPTDENKEYFRLKFDRCLAETCLFQEVAYERIIEYREQTSDMFMVSLMNMSAFSYLYMMARNIQYDERQIGIKLRRIAIVLYICFCDGKKKPFGNILAEIYDNANLALSRIVQRYYLRSEEKPQIILHLRGKIAKEKTPIDIANRLEEFIRIKDEVDTILFDYIRTFRNLFVFLHELDCNKKKYISEIDHYKYVKQDLLNGFKAINIFREEFLADKVKSPYYLAASELLSHQDVHDEESHAHNNEMMIEFIMKMYYETKETYGHLVASSAEQKDSPEQREQ